MYCTIVSGIQSTYLDMMLYIWVSDTFMDQTYDLQSYNNNQHNTLSHSVHLHIYTVWTLHWICFVANIYVTNEKHICIGHSKLTTWRACCLQSLNAWRMFPRTYHLANVIKFDNKHVRKKLHKNLRSTTLWWRGVWWCSGWVYS